jgi:hypothetical protein
MKTQKHSGENIPRRFGKIYIYRLYYAISEPENAYIVGRVMAVLDARFINLFVDIVKCSSVFKAYFKHP